MLIRRLWPPQICQPEIYEIFQEYLASQHELGATALPTLENAEAMCSWAADLVERGKGVFYVAIDDEEVVGFSAVVEPMPSTAWTALGTYVRPQYRKRGLAGKIRRETLKALAGLGCKAIIAGRYLDQEEPLHEALVPHQVVYLQAV